MRTLRKKNAAVVLATQSLSEIANSPYRDVILESCPTKLYLPNAEARNPQTRELYRKFGLSDRQIDIIAEAAPKRDYYYVSPLGRRLFQFALRTGGAGLHRRRFERRRARCAAADRGVSANAGRVEWLRARGLARMGGLSRSNFPCGTAVAPQRSQLNGYLNGRDHSARRGVSRGGRTMKLKRYFKLWPTLRCLLLLALALAAARAVRRRRRSCSIRRCSPASSCSSSRRPPPSPTSPSSCSYMIKNTTGGGAGVWQLQPESAQQSGRAHFASSRGFPTPAQGLAQQFQQLYPGYNVTNTPGAQSPQASVDTTLNTLNGALQSAQSQAQNFQVEQTALQTLEVKNQTAVGNLQAVQTGNEIALAQVQQIQMLRQLVMADDEFAEHGGGEPAQQPDPKPACGTGRLLPRHHRWPACPTSAMRPLRQPRHRSDQGSRMEDEECTNSSIRDYRSRCDHLFLLAALRVSPSGRTRARHHCGSASGAGNARFSQADATICSCEGSLRRSSCVSAGSRPSIKLQDFQRRL